MPLYPHNDIRCDGIRIFYGSSPPASTSDGVYFSNEIVINLDGLLNPGAPSLWRCIGPSNGSTQGNWAAGAIANNPETFGPFYGSTATQPQNAFSFSWPCDSTYIITSVFVSYNSAAANGSVYIERDAGSTTVGAGVQQCSTVSLASTSNIVYAATMIGSPAIFSGGLDRMGIVFGGTAANLATLGGCVINVGMLRVI